MTVTLFQKITCLREGMIRMIEGERTSGTKAMSSVLWDTFTGSAPYREILLRSIQPGFLGRLAAESISALVRPQPHLKKRTIS